MTPTTQTPSTSPHAAIGAHGAEAVSAAATSPLHSSSNDTAPSDTKRTLGMKITDGIIYPLVTNPAVWGLSVVATYLTEKGKDRTLLNEIKNETKDVIKKTFEEDGKLIEKSFQPGEVMGQEYTRTYGWIGEKMAERGEWLDRQFMKIGMNEKQAQMGRFVTFSFADGTLLEPITSALEKRRNDISHGIDNALGTSPTDTSVYDEEPARGDGSLIAGRLMTAGIVVPTAVALGKSWGKDKNGNPNKSFNETLFDEPGIKIGNKVEAMFTHGLENIETKTLGEKATLATAKFAKGLDKLTGRTLDKPLLFKTILFEAFYTTVCTAGLYGTSLLFADKQKDKNTKAEDNSHPTPHTPIATTTTAAPVPYTIDQWATRKVTAVTSEKPLTRISPQREHHAVHDTETLGIAAQQQAL